MVGGIKRPIRYRCDLTATLTVPGTSAVQVKLLDLSEKGAFIATLDDVPYDSRGRLELALPGGEPFWVPVRVVRLGASQLEVRHPRVDNLTVSRLGVGLRFESFPASEIDRLRGFLELLDER